MIERSGSAERLRAPTVATGLDVIDALLPDGIPLPSTILVLSDPGASEEDLLEELVAQEIKRGKTVLYISLDNLPSDIRNDVQSHSAVRNADWSHLIFIDGYSKTVGFESEGSSVVDPENLSAIGIAISAVTCKPPVSLMVLDSLDTIIRKRGGHSAMEFLRLFVARTRQANCLAIAAMNRKAWYPALVASAEDIVEGVMELKVEEESDGQLHRSLRILKMVGAKYSTAWSRYDLSDDGVLVKEA